MSLSHHLLSVLVRWAHVVAMASILGGAILVWGMSLRSQGRLLARGIADLAQTYEWIFWAAIGVAVMTGVGNLGAFGDRLPGAQTRWGTTFSVKLLLVLALAFLSIPRTLIVATLEAGDQVPPAERRLFLSLYATSTLVVVAVLGTAVFLAHG